MGISRSCIADCGERAEVRLRVGIPDTRQGHQRIAGGSLGDQQRPLWVNLIAKRDPVEHHWPARIDRESQFVSNLTRQLNGVRIKSSTGPDIRNGRFAKILLDDIHGALQIVHDHIVRPGRIDGNVRRCGSMGLITDPAFLG